MSTLWKFCAALLLVACGANSKEAQPAGGSAEKTAEQTAAQAGPWVWTASNLGNFWCAYRSLGGPIESGPSFPIEVRIADREGGEALPIEKGALAVDARMPEHGHGMLQRVEIQALPGREQRVDGMRLHMGGYWELYVDWTQGARTERAQFVIQL